MKNIQKQLRFFFQAIFVAIMLVSCNSVSSTKEPTLEPEVPQTPTVEKITSPTPYIEPTATSIPRDKLHIGLRSVFEYRNLDPKFASSTVDFSFLRNLYEGLTRLDQNMNVIPGAAESWDYNSEATSITFKLYPNLKYSDGSPLNAKRFEYSIKRALTPEKEWSIGGDFISTIKGAEELLYTDSATLTPEKIANLRNAIEVKAINERGVACQDYNQLDCLFLQINFNKPTPSFHEITTMVFYAPVKEEIASESSEWWKSVENHIGNGPFLLNSISDSTIISMIPNPNFHGSVVKYSLEYSYFENGESQFSAYQNNEIDIMSYADSMNLTLNEDQKKNELIEYPGSSTSAIVFNLKAAPFQDPEIRKAFAYAFDRRAFIDQILEGNAAQNLSWIPINFPGFDGSEDRWNFDPEAAKTALRNSSYYDAQTGVLSLPPIKLTFYHQAEDNNNIMWTAIRDQFQSVFGEEVIIQLEPIDDYSVYYARLRGNDEVNPISMFISSWIVDYPDPHEWLAPWAKYSLGRQSNYQNYNPNFTQLVNSAEIEPNDNTRNQMYKEAQDVLITDIPAIFGWNQTKKILIKPWVKGINPSAADYLWAGDNDPTSVILN